MNVLKIGEKELSLEELAGQIKITGGDAVLKPLIRRQAILECAGAMGLVVSDEALQKRFDVIRKVRGLVTAADTRRWMDENGCTLDDLELEAEAEELAEMLAASIDRAEVEKYFVENRLSMDAAEISIITVAEREVACELAELLQEGTEDFITMALEHSTDSHKKAGGYIGIVKRPDIPETVAAAVFGAKPGEVAGPIEREGAFVLVKLHQLLPAELDGETGRKIRLALLERLLAEHRKPLSWLV